MHISVRLMVVSGLVLGTPLAGCDELTGTSADPTPQPASGECGGIELLRLSSPVLRGRRGEVASERIRIQAFDAVTREPRVGATIVIADEEGNEVSRITTNDDGEASTEMLLPDKVSHFFVDAQDNVDGALQFLGRAEGATDEIHVELAPCVVAGESLLGEFQAFDPIGAPILGGSFAVCAAGSDIECVPADVVENGDGRYGFSTVIERAGHYLLSVKDAESHATGRRHLHVQPASAATLSLAGAPDPRSEPPYGEVTAGAWLADPFGNALASNRIAATDEAGEAIATRLRAGGVAELNLSLLGAGERLLSLTDRDSNITTEVSIPFATAWLEDPGFVQVGNEFSSTVYLAPQPDTPVYEASVRIDYDPSQVEFAGFDPGPDLYSSVEPGDGTLMLQLASEEGLFASQNGISVGGLRWQALAAGKSCFTVSPVMSIAAPPWTLCVNQKAQEEACICVNYIHAGDRELGKRGRRNNRRVRSGLKDFPSVVGKQENRENCCPMIRVQLTNKDGVTAEPYEKGRKQEAHTIIPKREWNALLASLPEVDNRTSDFARLHQLVSKYLVPGCINIVLYPMGDGANADAIMGLKASGDRWGFGVIASNDRLRGNLVPHELGHAFDIRHLTAEGLPPATTLGSFLMRDGDLGIGEKVGSSPFGDRLTQEECAKIREHLSQWACK